MIVILSAVLLLKFRINSVWLIAAAGAFGWLHHG
jgi:chromate transport protein ChrA